MTDSLLMQSVNITVIGMLVVFTFLIVMVGLMKLLGILVNALEKHFPQAAAQPAAAAPADNALLAVAIAAAKRFQGK